MNNIKLFIDDVRMPADVGYNNADFIIARDWWKARQVIDKFKPQFISFDHDLGEDSKATDGSVYYTGYDIVKWMIAEDSIRNKQYITENFKFNVHSANPIGAKNIEDALNNYIEHKFYSGWRE